MLLYLGEICCYCHYLGNRVQAGGTPLTLNLLGRLVCISEFPEHSSGRKGSTLLDKLACQTPDPCVIFNCPEVSFFLFFFLPHGVIDGTQWPGQRI